MGHAEEKYQILSNFNPNIKNGLEIVGITLTSGSPDNIKSFMDDWDINYTILTDIEENETQVVTYNFGKAIGQSITGIPTTLSLTGMVTSLKGILGQGLKTFSIKI